MLNIVVKDLPMHTNLLAPLCVMDGELLIEGEVSGDSVLVHLGRIAGWVHVGIKLGTQEGERLKEVPRPIHHPAPEYLRSGLLPSHPLEGEC